MSEIVLRKDRHERQRRILQIAVLAVTGVFLSVFVAAYATGYWGISEKDGRLNYANDANMKIFGMEQKDNAERGYHQYEILENEAGIHMSMPGIREIYNYVKFSVYCESESNNASSSFRFADKEGNVLYEYEIKMDGEYYVYPLPEEEFSDAAAYFENMAGASIVLEKAQFRSNRGLENFGIFWLWFFGSSLVYAGLGILIYWIFKKKGIRFQYYLPLDCMIFLYDRVRRWLVRLRIQEKRRNIISILIRGLFCIGILGYVFYFMYTDSYWTNYNKHVLVISLGILTVSVLLPVLCSSKKYLAYECWRYFKKYPAMHNPLALAFFFFSALAVISEMMVNQARGWFGLFAMGVIGFFGYMAGRKEHGHRIFTWIEAVAVITFIPCMIQVLFINARLYEERGVGGIYQNPNQFAIYLVAVDTVLLSGINYCIEQEKLSVRFVIESLLLGAALFLTWETQCRSAILVCVLMVVCIAGKMFVTKKEWKKPWKVLLLTFLTIKLIAGVWHGSVWSMNNYSIKDEEYKVSADISSEVVYASDKEDATWKRLLGFTDIVAYSSGRILYYIDYIRNCNLVGHRDFMYVVKRGGVEPSHNAVIGLAYKYGIMTAVPYGVFLVLTFIYAVRFWVKGIYKKYNSMLPLGIVLAFFNMAMLDTVDERIFWCMLWVLFYLMAGYLMGEEKTIYIQNKNIRTLIKTSEDLGAIPDGMEEYMMRTYGKKKTYVCMAIIGIVILFSIGLNIMLGP